MRNSRWALCLGACVGVVLAGCGGASSGGASGSAGTRTLVVGSDIPYVPFEFGKAPTYTGFDMDLMHEVGRRLGYKIKVEKTPFDTIFRDLAQSRFDAVISSVDITPDREKVVAFSLPYFNADQSLMVKKGSPIKTLQDLAGRKVGVQLGGTGEDYAKTKLPSAKRKTYDIIGDAFNALAAGEVDGVVNDLPSSQYAQRHYPTLQVVQTLSTGEHYGIVFRKDEGPLRARVDTTLKQLRTSGWFDRLYHKWFGAAAPSSLLR